MNNIRRAGRTGPRAVLSLALIGLVIALALAAALMPIIGPPNGRTVETVAAAGIFVGSYTGLAIGKLPGLSIDRAGIALVGAALMVASGALPLEDAYKAIDLDTITLLLGVMIVVANLRLSGFFALTLAWIMSRARTPALLLAVVVLTSGVFSAFLVNDAICLVMTPLVLDAALRLNRKPAPYLLGVAMASNIGSVATITGNPQNIMIGSLSHIPYTRFASALTPVAALGLLLTYSLIALAYRRAFREAGAKEATAPAPVRARGWLVVRSLLATLVMIVLFFAGTPPAKAAIIVGALLMLTRRLRSARIYADIDWSLLLMFCGLFIIVAGAQRALLSHELIAAVAARHPDRIPVLSALTAVLSNLLSNVPAVLVLKPFVETLRDHDTAWLVVAMSSTLAGNFTLLGSVANLIVVEKAARRGVVIGFWEYARIGAPLTLLTLAAGTIWLMLTAS